MRTFGRHWLVSPEQPLNGVLMHRDIREGVVHDYEPITMSHRLVAAKDVAPRELPLSMEIDGDDAFVVHTALAVQRSFRFVESMAVA